MKNTEAGLSNVAEENLLASLHGAMPPSPEWFQALDCSPAAQFVTVDGARIEFLTWGELGAPGLLLVHGNRAHARWWGPVAPLLAQAGFRVASMSFSGHGGSSWRDAYHVDQLATEMFAVAAAAGLQENSAGYFIAAHSFGGGPTILATEVAEPALAGILVVDTGLMQNELKMPDDYSRKLRSYGSLTEGLARFRLAPPQPCENLYLLDFVGRNALVEENGAWRWCFDPNFLDRLGRRDTWAALAAPKRRMAIMYGELSTLVTGQRLEDVRLQAPPGTPFISIPQAGHHVMLDQPLALTAAINAVLACWLSEAAPAAD
jgi:pimeloyl-ACP methyl ester carboxylesterase